MKIFEIIIMSLILWLFISSFFYLHYKVDEVIKYNIKTIKQKQIPFIFNN